MPALFQHLRQEYPEFGGVFEVVHHTQMLAGLLEQRRLVPAVKVEQKVVFHDPCYLSRYNGIVEPPRRILSSIPGLTIVEPDATRNRSMCCGGGGAGAFIDDAPGSRVNSLRASQLLKTGAGTTGTACPWCMSMLRDEIKATDASGVHAVNDVATLLAHSVGLESPPRG